MPKYENFSKEELLRFIEKQEQELKQKKYGLVWDAEREPEQVVLDCENNLPVLKRVKGKAIKEPKNNGAEDNILIEGDNYHALTVLNYTYKEKIVKKLKKFCALCGKPFSVLLYANRKYRGGHYFGNILDFKDNSKEYWECPKCYKGN